MQNKSFKIFQKIDNFLYNSSIKKDKFVKKIVLIVLFCVSFLFAEIDFKVYFNSVQNHNVLEFKNPFFYEELKRDDSLRLQAIFNDKAKINEQWYQKNDIINKAKILEISQKQGFVLFEKEGGRFYLYLKRVSHKIFIQ